jgi:hypothetical protein
MKGIKLFIIFCFTILILYYSCTSVKVTKHPDYNFVPTNPQSVIIYDRLMPTYKFIIIGRIDIDATWTLSSKEAGRKVQEKAAAIGGDAVIITDIHVDIVAFNRSVTTKGTITDKGDKLEYYAVSRDTSTYIPIQMLYGYVIKRQIPQSVGVSDYKTGSNDYKNKQILVSLPNGVSITAELVVTDEERQQGLMHREKIDSDQGMLFVFEEEDKYPFWMKNMKFSIDILWLDRDKRIVHIERKLPPCKSVPCPSYAPLIPAMYVLELKAGSADENHLKLYDKLEFILTQKNR